jgi:UTP--glucose-1-phosphate uridylyltransferase
MSLSAPRVRKAVIPAAGLGTRFLPATKAIPKEMLPIVDVPTIQLVVEEALASGIEEIVLVTGRGKAAIEDHFDLAYELEDTLARRGKKDLHDQIAAISRRVRLLSVRQKEPLGLGHAVLVARQAVGDEPVAVLLGDDLIDAGAGRPGIGQLVDEFQRLGGAAGVIANFEVPAGQEHLYGIVAGELVPGTGGRLLKLHDLVEKPAPGTAPTRLAIIGRYVLPREIWPILERTPPGKGGEIQLTDALKTLAQAGGGCYGYRFHGVRHDAGDRLGYLGANLAYALQRDELRPGLVALMRELVARHGG